MFPVFGEYRLVDARQLGRARRFLVAVPCHALETTHLRREVTLTTMPILVLTAEEGPGVERRVLDLGADDYILKPFEASVLLSRVQAVFRRITAAVAA